MCLIYIIMVRLLRHGFIKEMDIGNKIDNGINIKVIAEAVQADNIADTCVVAFKKATENGQTISKYTN